MIDRAKILAEMGIKPLWRLRNPPAAIVSLPAPVMAMPALVDGNTLANAVRDCRACPLCETRQQALPGEGPAQSDYLFVAWAPTAEEDQAGQSLPPSTAKHSAAKLFEALLAAMGLQRQQVNLTHAVKCHSAHLAADDAAGQACLNHLLAQVCLLQPRVLVALDPAVVRLLLGDVTLHAGVIGQWQSVPIVYMPHPTALLQQPAHKAQAWAALCAAQALMK